MRFAVAAPGAARPAAPRKPRVRLAPVVPTRMLGGQCWGAETPDGEWGMDRLEDTGTTWQVVHKPTKTLVADFLGSLRQCRAYVGSGEAAEDLVRLLAHQRGEHKTGRDKACPACSAEEDDDDH
jgi:hypothetical protein